MFAALAWIAASFRLSGVVQAVQAVPVVLSAFALSQFVLLLRLGRPGPLAPEPGTRPGPEVYALAAIGVAGLLVVVVRLAS
jgi:hypothetical protein